MKNMHRITAARRNMAHQALQDAARNRFSALKDEDADWKAFWKDAARDNIGHARTLRLHGIEYPQIP
jgi:hypothetical protein